MVKIKIPAQELYDSRNRRFSYVKETTLCLEHSLLSITAWESKWHVPFIITNKRQHHTNEQMLDYIRCMTINKDVDPLVYRALTAENIADITAYIQDPMTATTIKEERGNSGKNVTSELIYYWMTKFQIPFDPCEKWHLNRLLTLIRVCNEEEKPKKKIPKADNLQRIHAQNLARRSRLHSKG